MKKKLFGRLVESLNQMNEITRGERAPSREFNIDAARIKALRKQTKLSRAKPSLS